MKKSLTAFAVLFCALALIASVVNAAEYAFHNPKGAKAAASSSGPIKVTVTTTHRPGGASYQMEQFMLQVFKENAPEGMFEFEMYDSGSLYKTDAEFPAILGHEVGMSFIQPSYAYDNGLKWANMMDMGYLYDSVDHLKAVYEPSGEIGAHLQQAMWDTFGVMTFGATYIGTRNLWLAKYKEIKSPADTKGLKIRMPTSASFVQLGEALGFNCVPLDVSEVYLALETGLIDGHENQVMSTYLNGQFEVTESLVFIEHMITPNFVCLDGEIWESMTEEQQKIFYECVSKARDLTINYVKGEEQKLFNKAEKEFNIKIQRPDKTQFKENVQKAYLTNSSLSGNWDLVLLDKINKLAQSMK